MENNKTLLIWLLILMLSILPKDVFASDIVGVVTDSTTGLPLPNIAVKIVETGDSTTTDFNGQYTFLNIPNGQYYFLFGGDNYSTMLAQRTVGSCCISIRGNVDSDINEIIDISDLVFLVDFMFTNGPGPLCVEEANVEGDINNVIDISDLVYLVDFMFTNGPQPPSCF